MLSVDEVKFGVVLNELPVPPSRWSIAMNIDGINLCHVDETGDTQVEQEVHLAAAKPDDVCDVRDELIVVARLRAPYCRRAVEQGASQSTERVVEVPDVAWVK